MFDKSREQFNYPITIKEILKLEVEVTSFEANVREEVSRISLEIDRLIEENKKYDMEFRIIRLNDNVERIMHSIAKIEFDPSGRPQRVLGVLQDITESKLNQEAIRHLAYYDVLTDLPNRVLFIDRLKIAMENAKRANTKIAVVFFDINNFKKI